jgi:hypothetical protein
MTAKAMPLREYVSATASAAPYASTTPISETGRRRANAQSPSGSAASPTCASAFQ